MYTLQPHLDGITVVILFGLLQCLSILVLFYIKRIFKENRLIMALVILLTAVQVEALLMHSGLMVHTLFLMNGTTPLILLIGPLVYGYTRHQIGNTLSMRSMGWHFVPALLYFIYSFNFFLQPATYKYNALVRSFFPHFQTIPFHPSFSSDPWGVQGWVVVELLCLSMAAYAIASLVQLRSVRKHFSSKWQWVRYLNVVLLVSALVLFLSQGGVVNGYVFFKSPFPTFAADICTTLFMYSITLYLILKPEHFRQHVQKYRKSSLHVDFKKHQLERICAIIESEKLYLQPDFSLDMLSVKTGLAKHHISQMLNEELNQNFYEFTHGYRIDEAKRILDKSGPVKIEQLAYQLGYKSKVTFFNAFKKATELTPAQYRVRLN